MNKISTNALENIFIPFLPSILIFWYKPFHNNTFILHNHKKLALMTKQKFKYKHFYLMTVYQTFQLSY